VYTTGAIPGLHPGFGRKRTVPAGATTHARTASGRTTGAIYGKQRSVHAFSPFYRFLPIIPFVLRHRPLSCFTKTIPLRWEFCISPSMPPRDDFMPKSDMAFFDKNLSLLTAKVWLI